MLEWIYDLVLGILLLLLAGKIYRQRRSEREKRKREAQVELYVAELMNCYRRYGSVEEAMEEAGERAGTREEPSGERIQLPYQILLERLCCLVMEVGDKRRGGESLFLKNLSYIREELKEDILFRGNQDYCFKGLSKLCLIPFFLIPCIVIWAKSVLDTLFVYYHGSFSVVSTTIAFATTAVCCELVAWLEMPGLIRELDYRAERKLLQKEWISGLINAKVNRHFQYYLKRNEGLKLLQGYGNIREFLLKKYCSGAGYFLFGIFLSGMIWGIGRSDIEEQLQFPELYTLMEEEEVTEVEEKMREQYRLLCGEELTLAEAEREWEAYDTTVAETAFAQVKSCYEDWKKSGRGLWILLLSMCFGAFGCLRPELLLLLRREHVAEERMEEIRRMQTVCMVLAQDSAVTVEEIIEGMEESAVLFRKALEETVDHFSYDRAGGIEKLREETACAPMGRICDMLIACSEVGIGEALEGMEEERTYTLREQVQQRLEHMRERAALAKVLAYLPFLSVLILKLIVPFVAEGLSQLQLYSNGMQNFF